MKKLPEEEAEIATRQKVKSWRQAHGDWQRADKDRPPDKKKAGAVKHKKARRSITKASRKANR